MDTDKTTLDFAAFFNERVRIHGYTLKKLSETSGIALEYLEALAEGRYARLPAAPYLRGYLTTLGRILEFDTTLWWDYFKEMNDVQSSGARDSLPKNRFAPRISLPYAWIGVVLLLGVIVLGIRYSHIIGRPTVELDFPREAVTRSAESFITVSGQTTDSDELFVNDERVPVAPDGTWRKQIILEPGLNSIIVRATKFLGQDTTVLRQVVYEAMPGVEPPPVTTSPAPVIE